MQNGRHLWLNIFMLIVVCINGAYTRRDSRSLALQSIAESGNLFAESIFQEILGGQSLSERNVLISPLSISIGLSMLREGASGKTLEEITNGLRINKDLNDEDVRNGFTELISAFKDDRNNDEDVRLQLANRVYVGQVYPIKQSFLQTARSHFFADAEQVNFGDMEAAAFTVNRWVQQATRNRIKDVIVPSMLTNQTAMILVNAIHFKGQWKYPFDPDNTREERFKTLSGQELPVKMMQLDRPRKMKFAKLPELKSSAVALPYTSQRYSFVILLPDPEVNLIDVERGLKDGMLAAIPSRMRSTSVDVRMPKLLLESSIDLIASKSLENLGMESMSTEFAEFGRLSEEEGLRITNVIHKAFLEVNEAGSEAAAASAFIAQARSLDIEPENAVKFIVDRPFIAYIFDSITRSILFVARKVS
ncbi:Serpin B8 [Orchesella cincta]|uniref:Serpin B8 n=1 Tax=Orchesella cincta TaxID=48709 RepID=A0A1D2N4T0_ORCCI|nr:Serpin B8 [Orchesella cincta]